MDRKLKDWKVLEITDDEISIAFWYENGEKEIVVVKRDSMERALEEIKNMRTIN